ncbi:MAG: hypothetical protein M0Q95_18085 [Porticoccaceae bacterium]|nr:hypothetical protein [Porticoccaceae bacterium]
MSQRETPSSDSGEEVALGISSKVIWLNILDTPFVNVAGRNMSASYQVSQPLSGERVNLVVVGGHAPALQLIV